MAYADFEFYTTSYLGDAIAESDFDRLALRASAIIDRLTFGRAADDTDNETAIKNAMCAVAEEIQTIAAEVATGYVTSETVGSHSVTYASTVSSTMSDNDRYHAAAKLWLESTFLMFAGFASGEYGGTVDTE